VLIIFLACLVSVACIERDFIVSVPGCLQLFAQINLIDFLEDLKLHMYIPMLLTPQSQIYIKNRIIFACYLLQKDSLDGALFGKTAMMVTGEIFT
jgi:hypothetical protein